MFSFSSGRGVFASQSIKQRNWTPPTRLRSFEKAAPIA